MPTDAINAFGTTFKIGTTFVGYLTDISPDGATAGTIDITQHGSASATKEFMGGLIDSGSISLTGIFKPADVGQAALFSGIGTTETFLITYIDGTTIGGSCVIEHFGGINAPLEKELPFAAKVKVTGPLTITP